MAQIEPVIDAIARFIGKTQEFVSTHAEEIKGALLAIGGVLAAAGIVSGILAIVGAIGAILSPVGLVVAAIGVLGAAWAGNWGGIQEKTQAALDFIQNLIQTVFAAIQAFWQEHGDTIIATATAAWEGIQAAIDTVLAVIDSIWQAFKAAFEGDWTAFGENLRAAWDTAWEAIKTALSNAGTAILSTVSTLILNMIAKFRDTDWKQLATNVIDGLINGLAEGLSRVVSKMNEIGQAAWNAWNGFWDSNSPSKLANEGAGYVTGGIVQRFDQDQVTVAQAATNLGEAAYGGLFGGNGALGAPAAAGASDGMQITLDLRGAVVASQSQLEQWIQGALNKTGQRANQIRRTRG